MLLLLYGKRTTVQTDESPKHPSIWGEQFSWYYQLCPSIWAGTFNHTWSSLLDLQQTIRKLPDCAVKAFSLKASSLHCTAGQV